MLLVLSQLCHSWGSSWSKKQATARNVGENEYYYSRHWLEPKERAKCLSSHSQVKRNEQQASRIYEPIAFKYSWNESRSKRTCSNNRYKNNISSPVARVSVVSVDQFPFQSRFRRSNRVGCALQGDSGLLWSLSGRFCSHLRLHSRGPRLIDLTYRTSTVSTCSCTTAAESYARLTRLLVHYKCSAIVTSSQLLNANIYSTLRTGKFFNGSINTGAFKRAWKMKFLLVILALQLFVAAYPSPGTGRIHWPLRSRSKTPIVTRNSLRLLWTMNNMFPDWQS